jgi:hypothetical protein
MVVARKLTKDIGELQLAVAVVVAVAAAKTNSSSGTKADVLLCWLASGRISEGQPELGVRFSELEVEGAWEPSS